MEQSCHLNQVIPPDILYHGTCAVCAEDVAKNGLISEIAYNVHLAADEKVAEKFAYRSSLRYGQKPVIYDIDCKQMLMDGFVFYQHPGIEHAYITNVVPSSYLTRLT